MTPMRCRGRRSRRPEIDRRLWPSGARGAARNRSIVDMCTPLPAGRRVWTWAPQGPMREVGRVPGVRSDRVGPQKGQSEELLELVVDDDDESDFDELDESDFELEESLLELDDSLLELLDSLLELLPRLSFL